MTRHEHAAGRGQVCQARDGGDGRSTGRATACLSSSAQHSLSHLTGEGQEEEARRLTGGLGTLHAGTRRHQVPVTWSHGSQPCFPCRSPGEP